MKQILIPRLLLLFITLCILTFILNPSRILQTRQVYNKSNPSSDSNEPSHILVNPSIFIQIRKLVEIPFQSGGSALFNNQINHNKPLQPEYSHSNKIPNRSSIGNKVFNWLEETINTHSNDHKMDNNENSKSFRQSRREKRIQKIQSNKRLKSSYLPQDNLLSDNDGLMTSSNSVDMSDSRNNRISEWIPGVAGAFLQKTVDTIEDKLFLSHSSNSHTYDNAKMITTEELSGQEANERDTRLFTQKYQQQSRQQHQPGHLNPSNTFKKIENEYMINNQQIIVYTPSINLSDYKLSFHLTNENTNVKISSNVLSIADFQLAITSTGLKGMYPYIPWTPYHLPQLPVYTPPEINYTPSLSSVKAMKDILNGLDKNQLDNLPTVWKDVVSKPEADMTMQKGVFEHESLKLHLCNGVFEAYSASYLTTKAHMIEVASENFNLSWVNCEMASFIHMKESRSYNSNPNGVGMIMQSLDVLDFSVIHLSTYERSSKKYKHRLWKNKQDMKTQWSKIDPVEQTAALLEKKFNPNITKYTPNWSSEAKRTLVVMPFLGGAMGAGHSELGNRFHYLRACFWSFYEFVPNIMMGVSRKEDVEWGWTQSGLPFYDIILLDNLPKSAGLPVGTTQQIKKRLMDGRYDFDYIFFTESDQILISRQLQLMYQHLKVYPSRMILPHRLMVYSDRVMVEVHNKSTIPNIQQRLSSAKDQSVNGHKAILPVENEWMTQSCCMERQNCQERKSWVPLSDQSVPVINYYGLYVPLGNVNFLAESYRTCTLGSYIPDYCP